jgi:hypothetical protein
MDGVDGILSVSPYYNKPTQEGIYQHYKAIAQVSLLPIILYNVPGRTGSNMTPRPHCARARLQEHRRHQGGQRQPGPDGRILKHAQGLHAHQR